MKIFFALLILLVLASCNGSHAANCNALDPNLLFCPSPQAPRITELKPGKVVVVLTVQADGTVANAKVVTSSGHDAWKNAVLEAVRQWKYKPARQGSTKTIPFDMQNST